MTPEERVADLLRLRKVCKRQMEQIEALLRQLSKKYGLDIVLE